MQTLPAKIGPSGHIFIGQKKGYFHKKNHDIFIVYIVDLSNPEIHFEKKRSYLCPMTIKWNSNLEIKRQKVAQRGPKIPEKTFKVRRRGLLYRRRFVGFFRHVDRGLFAFGRRKQHRVFRQGARRSARNLRNYWQKGTFSLTSRLWDILRTVIFLLFYYFRHCWVNPWQ